jgi:hypothetical protein
MTEFEWMAETLRLMTLDELRDLGVTVYQAPKVPKRAKVVNLMNGVVLDFSGDTDPASEGNYAKYDEVLTLAHKFGLELVEEDRVLRPIILEEAGEPAEAKPARK